MKIVIPEQVNHFCDKCNKQIDGRDLDCKGFADFTGRDYQGAAVGGYRKEFELCQSCASALEIFLSQNKGEK